VKPNLSPQTRKLAMVLSGYEIEVPQLGGRDSYSTGDIWVTVYRGDGVQQGGDVGVAAPTDEVLEKVYATDRWMR
jgi:hypothetical protein